MNTESRLQAIGDRLERAFAADLRAHAAPPTGAAQSRSRLTRRRTRWLAGAAAMTIAVPGIAYAAGAFTSPQAVANSLPAGAKMLVGSDPSCTVVQADVEYRCTLAHPPAPDPVTLTAQQQQKLTTTPTPHLGKVKVVNHIALLTPRQSRLLHDHEVEMLSSFGLTPTQVQRHLDAIRSGTAGIPAGGFAGIVEPTVDASHHIDGGCRSTSVDGSQWECYIGPAAAQHGVIDASLLGYYIPSPGVG